MLKVHPKMKKEKRKENIKMLKEINYNVDLD